MKATDLRVGDRHTNPDVPAAGYVVDEVHVLVKVRYDSGASDLLQFDAAADVDVTRSTPQPKA
ncbi:MAG TPA: hypothetical protein VJ851_00710 [Jatrophihabitans sp.]|nr:hypothetical protein [Jatrophihabitans sp.]